MLPVRKREKENEVEDQEIERIVQNFQVLGFTIYGAKAYLCLMQQSIPQTGYEIGKKASIPRSKVYEVLDQLQKQHLVIQAGDRPKKYLARNPEEVLSVICSEYDSRIRLIRADLKKVKKGETVDFLTNIFGKDIIVEKARELLRKAKKSILIAICPEMLEMLKSDLRKAQKRSVDITIVAYSRAKTGFSRSYSHILNQPDISTYAYILLDRDFEEVLAGTMFKSSNYGYGIWTKNAWLRNILHDNIIHEIYLGILEEKLGLIKISNLAGKMPTRLWNRANREFQRQFRQFDVEEKPIG